MSASIDAAQPAGYFDNVRTEIASLLPEHSARVLDIGCASGATLQWLKAAGRAGTTVGIERFEEAAQRARSRIDELHVGDALEVASMRLAPASFDLVLCLDVLEHLVDPWATVVAARELLRPGGLLVASIPNVRHLRVVLPLVLAGRWRYEDAGILDRTHLRFFTRHSALALLSPPGLQVQRCLRRMPPAASKAGALNLLALGLLRDFVAMGYLISSRRV